MKISQVRLIVVKMFSFSICFCIQDGFFLIKNIATFLLAKEVVAMPFSYYKKSRKFLGNVNKAWRRSEEIGKL